MYSSVSGRHGKALGLWRRPVLLVALWFVTGAMFAPRVALPHGINGHVHVTAWSLAELDDVGLVSIFDSTIVVDALLFGAAFPDTGYATENDYGELAHWEPFVDALVEHVRAEYPPPFEDEERQRTVAFVLGLAAHGLQDEIFDTLFLPQIQVHDGVGQDAADRGTDSFLYRDGHLEHTPEVFAPTGDLVTVFAECHGHAVTEQEMRAGMARVKLFVIDTFEGIADGIYDMYRPQLEWTAMHYMDPDVPGSLTSEVPATAAYLEAVWARLHGQQPIAARVVYGYPSRHAFLRDPDGLDVDRWVTLVFGTGVRTGSLTGDRVTLYDPHGNALPAVLAASRWAGSAESVGRLLVVKPRDPLRMGQTYTVQLSPGIEYVNGDVLDEVWRFEFRTPCESGGDPRCAPLAQEDVGPPEVAPGDDAGPPENRGDGIDSGYADASPQAGQESTQNGGCTSFGVHPSGWSWLFLLMLSVRRARSGDHRVRK